MTTPLKILVLGRDPDMFGGAGCAANDTRERHIAYVRKLQGRRPGSEVRLIVHTMQPGGPRFDEPLPGMRIYGTFSKTRALCPFDMARIIRALSREGWIADLVSCQTGYEEGPLALATCGRTSRIQIQMHADFYGSAFASGSLLRLLQQKLIRWTIRRSDHVRAVSHGIKESIVRSGDIAAERIAVAPVPISFQADARHDAPETPTVLFVGRLAAEKDLDLWCNVARIVQERVPAARFVIAGDGPERPKLERRAVEFGGAMQLPGSIPYGDLAATYARASVFLLTSEYEGLGRVVVEAMLARVPVVSTATLGPRELIRDGETGRVIDSREAAALASAVVELLRDPARALRMAEAAQSWAAANFGFDTIAEELVESWETAAALPKRSS